MSEDSDQQQPVKDETSASKRPRSGEGKGEGEAEGDASSSSEEAPDVGLPQEALFSGPLLAAHAGDLLAGYVALLLDRTTCTIARLGVHPDWQGQGIGRALLLAGLRHAQAWGCSRALLNTQSTNYRSQHLYRSFGFRPTGESFSVFVLDLPGAPAHPARLEAVSTNR